MSSEINPKKRILLVITQAEMGGAQRFFLELLPRLDREKYEISIAVGSTAAPSNEFAQTLKEDGFPVYTLNNLKRDPSFLFLKDWLAVFELRKLIKRFRPDTLFLNSSKAGFIGSLATVFPSKLATKNYKLKTVYRIGGWTFNDPWPWWKKKFWIILEKISAHWKDFIIVNNRPDLAQAQQLKIAPASKIILVSNALDPYKIKFLEKEEARQKLQADPNQTIIGTIANLYPSKGIEYLIEAAALLKEKEDLKFLIIGDGPLAESLKLNVKSLNLENKVFFLGHLENARQYLPAFDIFVLPSLKEGFPWVVLEAMAAKLPIIATEVGAVPEMIENGKNGFMVKPGQPKQIAEKIEELLKSDYLKTELGLQAHQTVLFKFSPEKMVREVKSLL